MHLPGHFNTLLSDTVNLGRFKPGLLDERVEAIYTALEADTVLGPYVRGKIPQGSWAHQTIISPRPGMEFDADVLLRLDESAEWSADPAKQLVRAELGEDDAPR